MLTPATTFHETVTLSFVIPSEAEGSAVLRTFPGNMAACWAMPENFMNLPSVPVTSNPEKILRANLSPLQHQLQSVKTSRFPGMCAAQWCPRGKRSGKREGRKTKLLHSMGRSITTTQNNAANAGLLHQREHQAAESEPEFLVVGRSRRRTQRGVEHCISPRS
jgi:hypothetical protein